MNGQSLVGMELGDLREALGPKEPGFRAKQIYHAIYAQRVRTPEEITSLPVALRHRLAEHFQHGLPEVASFFDSRDGTRRYLLRLSDGLTVETVLMPEESRDTICISSQVGCPVNCQFCLTAQMGLERNLT
ncbi:MAG TPA: 23S rRNA (adenine(2503)-C(2))-methyltransferase RlmN, partial [Bryobacteraceae bacterium]|nr:23S rRNA (adenine(2503)-C(2))-methyltransferase RlmN [Bryobacteraceae bacterium]